MDQDETAKAELEIDARQRLSSASVDENIASISIIVPLFNEIAALANLLKQLQRIQTLSCVNTHLIYEFIAIDGGSSDGSWRWLMQHWHKPELQFFAYQSDKKGRAQQMNLGAQKSVNDVLLFLHADTSLANLSLNEILSPIARAHQWGRFDLAFIEPDWRMQIIAFFINKRSRLSGIATGDQAIWVSRQLFDKAGAYPNIPLMEDIALSKKLNIISAPYLSKQCVKTSARRWLKSGVLKTVFLMWYFRFAYFVGVDANTLAKQYRNVR